MAAKEIIFSTSARNEIAKGQGNAECTDPDNEARAATAKELAQAPSRYIRAEPEESVNGLLQLHRLIRESGRPVQVDSEGECC